MVANIVNGDSRQYWAGAAEGRLRLQRCAACGNAQFPPRHLCVKCWSEDLAWIESRGRGTVESFTIVHRAPLPEFRTKVPYVVAAVLLEEGPRMMTNIVGSDPLAVAIGDAVRVTFIADQAGRILPQFQRALQ